MYKRRLDGQFGHTNSCLPADTESNRRRKLSCILCCAKCESKYMNKRKLPHSRLGRTSTKLCYWCRVVLCVNFHDVFHDKKYIPLPKCIVDKLGIKHSSTKRNLSSDYNLNDSNQESKIGLRKRRKRASSSLKKNVR